ncbi:hypothetical protein HQ576_01475 [bacterium]|nr:hypothetical protein [bacterium]
MIKRILLPVYEREGDRPSFGHALWLAEQFQAEILIAGVVDESRFMRTMAGPTEGMLAYRDRDALNACTQRVLREADALVEQAIAQGRSAARAPSTCSFPDGLTELTRQCDILVESRLHRNPVLSRKLLDRCDLYSDASCPILVSRGAPFEIDPILLIYTASGAANRALAWVTELAEHIKLRVHALVLDDDEAVRARLTQEVAGLATAHGLEWETSEVAAAEGFRRAVRAADTLAPAFIALPTHAFKHPLRLRLQGIDEKALEQLACSVLAFP